MCIRDRNKLGFPIMYGIPEHLIPIADIQPYCHVSVSYTHLSPFSLIIPKTPFHVVIKKCFELSGKQPLVDGIAFLQMCIRDRD